MSRPRSETRTAQDMIQLLRRHLVPDETRPAGIFAPEIQAPGSARRADLIWLGCTAATGRELVGFEVKVNRADLLAELDDLTKSDPWQRYCDRWNLVLPDLAMAAGVDLPPTWGLLTPPSGRRTRSMTVEVRAPRLQPVDQAPAMRTLLSWAHWRHHRLDNQHQALQRRTEHLAARCRELEQHVPTQPGTRARREQDLVARIVRELGAGFDGDLGAWSNTVPVDDVIAVLKDLAAASGVRARVQSQIDYAREQLLWMHRQISTVLNELTDTPATDPAAADPKPAARPTAG